MKLKSNIDWILVMGETRNCVCEVRMVREFERSIADYYSLELCKVKVVEKYTGTEGGGNRTK